jgi:hypothetical protein
MIFTQMARNQLITGSQDPARQSTKKTASASSIAVSD